jgi:hypothetical protein
MSTIKSSAENLTLNADGANNDVIIQSNGSTKVTVDGQNSRVGIGTTSPTQPLHVAGNIYTTGYLNTAGSGTAGGVQFADGNLYMYRATNDLAVKLQGAEKLRIQSGGGISFNGDTAAANALNDYEEGTWTPVIGGNSESSQSYDSQVGRYTKIGNMVFCHGHFALTAEGSITGYLRIKGFPFTVSPTNAGAVSFAYSKNVYLTADHVLEGWVYTTNVIYLYETDFNNEAPSQIGSGSVNDTTSLSFSFFFTTPD